MKRMATAAMILVLGLWGVTAAPAGSPAPTAGAETAGKAAEPRIGIEACAGIQGILSFVQLGVRFPGLGNSPLFLGVGARLASSLTWATFIDMDTAESVSFHPVVASGVLAFGGASPLLYDAVRMYGGIDLHLGYTFTPYDSAIYGTGNLLGDNLTFAFVGYFGFELFTTPRLAMFIDAGGGFKSLFGDEDNAYVVASSWLGSGFGFRMGLRLYRLRA
jgi:hypothetical protein